MRAAWGWVWWGGILAAGLASGEAQLEVEVEVERQRESAARASADIVNVRRAQADEPPSRCYAEYWYNVDPSRRVRVHEQPFAPREDFKVREEELGRGCRGGRCQCGSQFKLAQGPSEPRIPFDASSLFVPFSPRPESLPPDRVLSEDEELSRGCDWPCLCSYGVVNYAPPPRNEFISAPQTKELSPGPALPPKRILKIEADAIVTVNTLGDQQDTGLITWSGPREFTVDETVIDLSSLRVRCKDKTSPRSGHNP